MGGWWLVQEGCERFLGQPIAIMLATVHVPVCLRVFVLRLGFPECQCSLLLGNAQCMPYLESGKCIS